MTCIIYLAISACCFAVCFFVFCRFICIVESWGSLSSALGVGKNHKKQMLSCTLKMGRGERSWEFVEMTTMMDDGMHAWNGKDHDDECVCMYIYSCDILLGRGVDDRRPYRLLLPCKQLEKCYNPP